MERLRPGGGALGAAFWDSRARRYAKVVAGSAERDPFLARVRPIARPGSTVIDVGAGSGRFTLALAPRVRVVTAVDPSRVMLSIIRQEARRQELANVHTVLGRWEEADVAPADVVICSFVLGMIEDAPGFLRKLDAAAIRRAFVYLSALSAEVILDPLWRHFHGTSRRPAPSYLDAAAVLEELGFPPEVEVVEVPTISRFPTLNDAVRSYRENLLLTDDPGTRRELRKILSGWLIRQDGGLRPPFRTTPSAILSWAPSSARRQAPSRRARPAGPDAPGG